MEAENLVNGMYVNALDNRPTFTDAMLEHMREEVIRIKEEAIKWHNEHKDKNFTKKL